jgi:hypothetical protein
VYRLVTAHPGVAVAGLLKYRSRREEQRRIGDPTQGKLFDLAQSRVQEVPQVKYRRQSLFLSSRSDDSHIIRWNKSFDSLSCAYRAAKSDTIETGVERLPNQDGRAGLLEVIRAPYQRDDADRGFPDLLFLWTELTGSSEL